MTRFKLLLIVAMLVGSVSIFAYSQDTITPEDAAKFIGHLQKKGDAPDLICFLKGADGISSKFFPIPQRLRRHAQSGFCMKSIRATLILVLHGLSFGSP
ncbi:exported hypothetical protein [Syntrophobacter sp. SbD2]|nr:exported hypothetical protein [Syntrophobacter sp. SbD2]